ncbi:MAG TPA: hypothetical protein VFI02_00550 [Armatimonadota bacterium]|nr:hypothetical protein [Armatimonadota bacterium]
MTTEVQITKNRSHLLYFRKVMSVLASRMGMSRRAIAETHHAVVRICTQSEGCLNVHLSTSEMYLIVEISGSVPEVSSLKRMSRLVDKVEVADRTITLTKCIRKTETVAYSPALGTTAPQS